jgi:hypothetical protein
MNATVDELNQFSRQAWSFIVEPTGLCKTTVERRKLKRGWNKRHNALITAHNNWVDATPEKFYEYSLKRAKASYDLLMYCMISWHIPEKIKIPQQLIKQ